MSRFIAQLVEETERITECDAMQECQIRVGTLKTHIMQYEIKYIKSTL